MLAAGVTVGLGTDSAASNNNLDLFDEIRLAALIHKGVSGDPTAVPAWEALKLGTVYGARAIWQEETMEAEGRHESGFYRHQHRTAALLSEDGNRVPSRNSVPAATCCMFGVDGVQVVRDGVCVFLDDARIRQEAQRCFERLLSS